MIRAVVLTLAFATPAIAGDPAGVDPAMLQTCMDAATTEGGVADCAGTGVAQCKAMWATRKPDLDPTTVLEGCTDAERQAWEALLTQRYDGLIADVQAGRPGEVEQVKTIRAMERSWIAFRDARCEAERQMFGHGPGGAIAGPECLMRETARQAALLDQMTRDN